MGNTASFGILGPLRVANAGQPLKPAGPRQRALLAALLVRVGRPVSLDGLIDALWGENPPVSAVANVHTYVSRLRRDLTGIGLPGRLTTDSAGYRLHVEPDELDSEIFEVAAGKAREALASGDAVKAVAFWQEAWSVWRGPLLDDVPRAGWLEADVVRLDEMAAAAREDSADARLAAGQYGALITELGVQVRQFPLREGLWWRLMRAQHQAGRRAEALETYRAVREVLVDALGVDPCDQIQDLHQEILRGGRAERPEAGGLNPVRPMQLPPDVDNFTGRDAELAELREVLTRRSKSTLAAITGKAGVGKTSLAVRAAHGIGDQFSGGQLYVRLGGTSPSPRDPATVLAELLIALGVHPHAVPEDVEARAALYRSQLAARQVLIVLDDARSMAQVRPLLPGSDSSAVLVTSRVQLVGAQTVHLDVLGAEDAIRLLGEIAGQDRMAAEPAAAAAVARYCGNLPLALRIAASRLARRGHWTVGRLAERLAGEGTRLNELRIDDLEARASLAWSYEALDDVQRRAFRLLGLLDVPDFPGWVVAALLGIDVHDAEEIVDSLADVHLLEVWQGRYRFHALLRVFARERAGETDAEDERANALHRAFTAWRDRAVQAESGLPCRFLKVRLDPGAGGPVAGDPLAWLEAERDALVGVVEQALKLGMTSVACDLACALTTLFDLRSHYDLWRHTHELALTAAEDERHQAILHQGLGALAFYRDRYGEASEHFARAQEIFAGTDEHRGHAYAHLGLGSVHLFHGRQDEAAVHLGQARETFRDCDDLSGEAFALQAMGIVHRNQDRLDEAARCLGRALEIFRGLDSRYGQACALFSLGLHHKARGDLARTEQALLDAIDLFRSASCSRDEALALHVLAATYAEQGDAGKASEMMSRSLTVFPQEDESVGKAATLYSLGWVAHRNQRLDEAAACFEQALRLFDRLGMRGHAGRTVDALRQLGLTVPDRRS